MTATVPPGTYNVDNLQFQIQRIIPMVYDDSLSMYELVNAVVAKLNEVITDTNAYFGQDLQQYVDDQLNTWKSDGTMSTLINQTAYDALQTGLEQLGVNVRYAPYNAKADGVTDDSSAIQSALNNCPANGFVILPPGTYLIKTTITQNSNVRVVANGATIKAGTNGMNLWQINGGTQTGGNGSLGGANFDGNSGTAANGVLMGGATGYVTGFKTIGVTVFHVSGDGFQTGDNFWMNTFINCQAAWCGNAFHHEGGNNAGEAITFISCDFYNSTIGFLSENAGSGGQSLFFYGCSFDYNSSWGVKNGTAANTGNVMSLFGCHIESPQQYWINYGTIGFYECFFVNGGSSGTLGWLAENHQNAVIAGGWFQNGGSGVAVANYSSLSYHDVVGLNDYGINHQSGSKAGFNVGQEAVLFDVSSPSNAPKNSLFMDDQNNVLSVKDNAGNLIRMAPLVSALGAIGANATITPATGITNYTVSPSAAVTGVIMGAGVLQGQEIVITNLSANSVTFAAAGSNVAGGSSVVIAAQTAKRFIWDSSTSLWYPM